MSTRSRRIRSMKWRSTSALWASGALTLGIVNWAAEGQDQSSNSVSERAESDRVVAWLKERLAESTDWSRLAAVSWKWQVDASRNPTDRSLETSELIWFSFWGPDRWRVNVDNPNVDTRIAYLDVVMTPSQAWKLTPTWLALCDPLKPWPPGQQLEVSGRQAFDDVSLFVHGGLARLRGRQLSDVRVVRQIGEQWVLDADFTDGQAKITLEVDGSKASPIVK